MNRDFKLAILEICDVIMILLFIYISTIDTDYIVALGIFSICSLLFATLVFVLDNNFTKELNSFVIVITLFVVCLSLGLILINGFTVGLVNRITLTAFVYNFYMAFGFFFSGVSYNNQNENGGNKINGNTNTD